MADNTLIQHWQTESVVGVSVNQLTNLGFNLQDGSSASATTRWSNPDIVSENDMLEEGIRHDSDYLVGRYDVEEAGLPRPEWASVVKGWLCHRYMYTVGLVRVAFSSLHCFWLAI